MVKNQTLYDKAVTNLNSALILRKYAEKDESQLNIIAYHLQQSLESAIKYLLEMDGVRYPKTHDVDQLIQIAEENNVDLKMPARLADKAEMLTLWEQKSRYVLNYKVDLKKIDSVIPKLDKYLKSFMHRT